jgi:hypothetical protein
MVEIVERPRKIIRSSNKLRGVVFEYFKRESMKTAYELLSDSFRGRPSVFKVLKLGETNISLNKNQRKILRRAIKDKDYYEIKKIVRQLTDKASGASKIPC